MSDAERAPIIGHESDGKSCVSCGGHDVGTSTMPADLRFYVCPQCHDNGDFKDWFMEWFKAQFEEAIK